MFLIHFCFRSFSIRESLTPRSSCSVVVLAPCSELFPLQRMCGLALHSYGSEAVSLLTGTFSGKFGARARKLVLIFVSRPANSLRLLTLSISKHRKTGSQEWPCIQQLGAAPGCARVLPFGTSGEFHVLFPGTNSWNNLFGFGAEWGI